MAYQLIERPHKFSFTKNPISYVINIDNPDAPGSALDIELYALPPDQEYAIDNPGTLIIAQTLYPNPNGRVHFYCEDYLYSWLDWELPSLSNNDITVAQKQVTKFYIKYRQVTRANTSPPWAIDAANICIAIKGGIAKEKFDRNNFFINELPAKKPFLTWQPADHLVGIEERRYLTYLHTGENIELFLMARVVYTDGAYSQTQKAFPDMEGKFVFHCPAGMEQLGLFGLEPDKKVWFYEVSIEDENGNIFSKPYRLTADYRKYYNTFSFIYHNSLGGIDTLRIRGEFDVETVRSYTEIEKASGGDFSNVELPTENGAININTYQVYKGDAGWQNTARMQESLLDLLHSENSFRIVNGRWLKVINMQKSQVMGSSDDTTWSFPLQWRYTFNNTQFTPFDKDFGAGIDDTEPGEIYGTCTAPSNLLAEPGAEVDGVKPYHFSWDIPAAAIGYEFQYKKSTDPEWTTLQLTDPEADVNFDVEGEYSWRVRTICGEADFSGYVYGIGFVIDLADFLCASPASLTVVLLSIDGANATIKFSWPAVPGISWYQLQWNAIGTVLWNGVQQYQLTYIVSLPKDKQYQAKVQSQCADPSTWGPWVFSENFIPSNMVGTCNPPTNLLINLKFGGEVFSFSWTNVAGVAGYDLRFRKVGDAVWNTADNVASPFIDLKIFRPDDTPYEWQMRSRCTGGGFSNWINGPNFST